MTGCGPPGSWPRGRDWTSPIPSSARPSPPPSGPPSGRCGTPRAADLLRTAGADPERVGLQLLQAEPGGDARAVDLLRAAAQAASTRGAPESATAYLRRALAEPPDAAARPHVELELGLALAARRHPDAPALLHAAIAGLPAGPVRGEAGLRAARAVALAALYADVVALCRATLAQPAGIAPETIARLEAELDGMAMTRAGTLQEVRERPRRESTAVPLWRITAAALAGFAGHPARESMALVRPVLPAEVLAAERESLVATVVLTLVLLWNDELEAATMVADRQLAAARPRGWASALANGSFLRAEALLRRGEVAEAEADARDAFAFKRTVSPPDSLAWTLVPLVDVLRERDDLDGAERALGAGSVEALTPDLLVFPLVRQARARLRLAQGRPREALADVRAAAASWTELGITGPGMSSWRLWAAEALMALGEQEEAAVLAAEQLRLAERLGAAGPMRRRAARGGALRAARGRARDAGPRGGAAGGQRGGARADACAVRPRRGAAPERAPRGGAGAAAPRARARRPRRRAPARRPCPGRAALRRRAAAAGGAGRARRAHARRAPRRRARGGGADEPPDRPGAVRHAAHGRDAPHARLREARRRVARGAARRVVAGGNKRGARAHGRGVMSGGGVTADPLAAGRAALRAARWQEARERLEAAPALGESPEALEDLSWAAWWLDDGEAVFAAREAAYRLYRRRRDPAGAARMAIWLAADQLDFRGAWPVASGWLQRAHRLLDTLDPRPEHGWLAFHEGYLAHAARDTATATELAGRVTELGRRFDVPDLEMLGLALQGSTLVSCGRVAEGMRCLDEATATALGEEAAIPISGAWTFCFLVGACTSVLDFERASAWCDRIAAFADRYGSRYMLAFCRAEYGAVQVWRGRWEDAERLLEASVEDFAAARPAWVARPARGPGRAAAAAGPGAGRRAPARPRRRVVERAALPGAARAGRRQAAAGRRAARAVLRGSCRPTARWIARRCSSCVVQARVAARRARSGGKRDRRSCAPCSGRPARRRSPPAPTPPRACSPQRAATVSAPARCSRTPSTASSAAARRSRRPVRGSSSPAACTRSGATTRPSARRPRRSSASLALGAEPEAGRARRLLAARAAAPGRSKS